MPISSPGPDRPVHVFKAELFKALAHPVRVRTLELLAERDRAVSELLSDMRLEASHLSQHLAVLRRAGVVTARREGNTVRYSLAHPAVAQMLAAARTVLLDTLLDTRSALADLEDLAPSAQEPPAREPLPGTAGTDTRA